MRYVKIEIIFDKDHGPANYGWYVRTTGADGQQEDRQIGEHWWEDVLVPDSVIHSWAMEYFADPECRIEVKR